MTKPPLVLQHISVHASILIPRLVTMLLSLPLLLIALLFFHRFNPARLKTSANKVHHGWIARINRWLKPITKRLLALVPAPSTRASFGRSILSDALLTLQLSPMAVVFILGFNAVSLLRPVDSIMGAVLPAIFAVFGVLLSDISTRERTSGLAGVVFGSPGLKPKFIAWKFCSTMLVVLLFLAVPLIRLILTHPSAALSLLIGGALTAAGATALGIMSSNPKAFVAVFLMFLYISVSGMKDPTFDFAGFSGLATPSIQLAYSLVAAALLVAAEFTYRIQLKRNY